MRQRFERVARAAAGRPFVTLGLLVALALAGGGLARSLRPNAGSDTFVSSSSASYRATADDQRHFGSDAVVILVQEKLSDLVATQDLTTVSKLEACLGGQVLVNNSQLASLTPAKAGSKPAYGGSASACGQLMKHQPVQVVYGPGTFLNRAVAAVNTQVRTLVTGAQTAITTAETRAYRLATSRGLSKAQAQQAATAAGALQRQQELAQLEQLYLQSGISGTPSINDPQFIPEIVFDQTRGVDQPKARFAYLFPNSDSALIQVRLKASLSDAQQRQAIGWIRQVVGMPMFRLANGGTYTVSGVPVVTNDLATDITGSISKLLIAALLVMAAVLLLVFRSRLRLLPLAIALAAVGITFGVTSLAGASLTLASIAVLPILIGLGVDYAIQFQSRVEEARAEVPAGTGSVVEAVARAAGKAAPTIATAALATATGFLVLLLSPVPMVRGFGVLLVVGIAIAFACALLAGSAALGLTGRSGGVLGASVRGAGAIIGDATGAVRRPISKAIGSAPRPPARRLLSGDRGAPGSRTRGRDRARCRRMVRRHPDQGAIRRDQARAVEHAGPAEPAHARAGDGRIGRDRRDGPRRQRRDPERDRVDDPV